MNRLIEKTVFSGLVMACRFATCPTNRSPVFVKPTTDGVVRPPSSFGMTLGSPPSITATTEFVVPKSMPIILLIIWVPPETYKCLKTIYLLCSLLDCVRAHDIDCVYHCQSLDEGKGDADARG